MKFGGSSVASAERIKNVADRVKGGGKGHQVVVVCSAMGDVTDELLALCADASKGMEKPVEERLASIRETHLAALAAANTMVVVDVGRRPSLHVGVEWLAVLVCIALVAWRRHLFVGLLPAVVLVAVLRAVGLA